MKLVSRLLVVLVVLGMAGLVEAAKPDKNAPKPVKGTVVKVDGTKLVFKSGKGAKAKENTVTTDEKTKVTIEGKDAKLSDLKEGQAVVVTPGATADAAVASIEVPKPKAAAAAAPAAK